MLLSENGQGPRPIHWAARNGHVAVVDILLSAGACPVDATDHKGLTPLMMACMFGRSLMAAYEMIGLGYKKVRFLEGGYNQWCVEEREVIVTK